MKILRVLNLEDDPLDTELIHAALTDSGISCEMLRVQTRADFLAALEEGSFDLVLSDYSLPSFDGLSALKMVRETYPEMPFILVSGAIGEERAIEALKSGATDYVLKQRLERLVPAVRRAVREAEERTERKRAEEALERLKHQNELILKSAGEGLLGMDSEGNATFVNPAAAYMMGRDAGELLDRPVHQSLHHSKADGTPYPWEECPNHATLIDGEVRHVTDEVFWRKDGTSFPVEYVSAPIRENGEIVGAVIVFKDITERNRAEEALRQSEELYRTVVEQAAENIFLVDAETKRILEANTAFHRSLGYTAEEIRRLTLYDLVAHDQESIDQNIRHITAQRLYFIGERKYRRKDGSLADMDVSVSAIPYEGREVLCTVAHDITDRKRAEEELRQSEERFRATFEQAAVGVAHVAPDGKWLRVNQRLCDITGYTREELLQHSFQDITHADDLEADLEQLRRLLDGEIETYSMEKRYIKKDGSIVWGNLTVSMAREPSGASRYSIAVIQDITQRKRAEEALSEVRQAERSRMARDLHDGVLQDLVDVLQSLRVAQLTPGESESGVRLQREVEVLQRAIRGMREAIYDLHPEGSRERSFIQDVESLVELERRMAPNRDVDLVVEEGFPTELSGVTSRELFRIIQEALTNARRHSGARHVCVTLGMAEDEVWAEVSDDGKGFDARSTHGGMGLTAMQERAFLLGGSLEVIAELDEGTRVRLRVPRHS